MNTYRYDFGISSLGIFMRIWVLSLLVILHMQLYAASDFDREQIQKRISPIGNVHLEEETVSAVKPETAVPEPAKKGKGEAIYEQYCMTCHRDGLAGAPKLHDEADWKPRLLNKTIDVLTASAIKGLNAMPPKGTCQECSEADMKAAIEYMVPSS